MAVAGFRRSHLELYSDFTTDREATLAAVRRAARGEPSTECWPSRMRPEGSLPSLRAALPDPDQLASETPTIEKALAALGEAAAGIVGRKNLVLFTSGIGSPGAFGLYSVESRTFDPMVEAQSRIIRIDARDGSVATTFAGSAEIPFFTNIMGKHQNLDNGNLLISESLGGRAFEVTSEGRLVWEYINTVEDGVVGVISDAQRLGPAFDRPFFVAIQAACPAD